MKRSFVFALCLLAAGLMSAPVAHAAVDAFMWFDSIKGESMDPQHQGWIELQSYNFSSPAPAPPAGAAPAGLAKSGPGTFTFTKTVDKASPLLQKATGKHFPSVVIEMRKTGSGSPAYLKYELKNVMVSSFNMAGGGRGAAVQTESLTLNFASIELKYPEQKGPGPVGPKPGAIGRPQSVSGSPATSGMGTTTSR